MTKPAFRSPGPLGLHRPRGAPGAADAHGLILPTSPRQAPGPPSYPHNTEPAFKHIARDDFYRTLQERLDDPSKIDQQGSSLCGPAALMYLTAKHRRALYYSFLVDLYERGSARLGPKSIHPSRGCKEFNPGGRIAAADWVGLAGVRDSENLIFDYDDTTDTVAGITLPGSLAGWLEAVGFSNKKNETNLYLTKGEKNLREANQLFAAGYAVCLFIDAGGIQGAPSSRGFLPQTFTTPNHWVTMSDSMKLGDKTVQLTLFTWGDGSYKVPHGGSTEDMPLDEWLQNYYGYVACKP